MASATETANHVAASFRDSSRPIVAQTKALEKKLANWALLHDTIQQAVANASNIVKLNVGGTTFETSKHDLLRVEGSYFHALLGSDNSKPHDDTTDAYFLDMDPTLFRRVLFYLRTGTVVLTNGLTEVERDELKAMLEYLKLNQYGVATQSIRWNSRKKAARMTLSKDLRTVQLSRCSTWCGVIATEALEGTFQLRVDYESDLIMLGLCPLVGFDCESVDLTSKHFYCYWSTGRVCKKQSALAKQAEIQAGDVVTIQRRALEVVFTVNDGAPVQVPLVDPDEVLFPVVFMAGGTKVTVVD